MAIAPEVLEMIPILRTRHPQLADLPDEAVAQWVLQFIGNPENMPADQLIVMGQELLNLGHFRP